MIHTDYESRCSGESCRQGRHPCLTPEACRLADEREDETASMQMLVYLFAAVAAVALVLVITMWS